jgi:hypothetical protein
VVRGKVRLVLVKSGKVRLVLVKSG